MKRILSLLGVVMALCWTFSVSAQTLLYDWGVKNGVAGKIAGTQTYTVNTNGNIVSGDALEIGSTSGVGIAVSPAINPQTGITVVCDLADIPSSSTAPLIELAQSTVSPPTWGMQRLSTGLAGGYWNTNSYTSDNTTAQSLGTTGVVTLAYFADPTNANANRGAKLYYNGVFSFHKQGLQFSNVAQTINNVLIGQRTSTPVSTGMKVKRIQIYQGQLTLAQVQAAETAIKEDFTLPTTYTTTLTGGTTNTYSGLTFTPVLPTDLSKATLEITSPALNTVLNFDQAIVPFQINFKGTQPLSISGSANIGGATPIVADVPVVIEKTALDLTGVTNLVSPAKTFTNPYGSTALFNSGSVFNKGLYFTWTGKPASIAVNYNNTTNTAVASYATRTISVNFGGNTASGSTLSGAMPVIGSNWNNFTGATGTNGVLNVSKPDGTTESSSATITYSSSNVYQWISATDNVLKSYLDDGNTGPSITINNIPFAKYRVIVYRATDSGTGYYFSPTTINGVSYTSTTPINDATPGFTIKGSASFGKTQQLVPVKGVNYLVSDQLTTGTLTVAAARAGNGRGGVAAIQIVEVDDTDTFDDDELAAASASVRTAAQTKINTIDAIAASEIKDVPTQGYYLDTHLAAVRASLVPYLTYTAPTFAEVTTTLATVNSITPQVVQSAFNGVYVLKRPAGDTASDRGTYLGESSIYAASKFAMDATTFWTVTTEPANGNVIKAVNFSSGNQVEPKPTDNTAFTLTNNNQLITLAPLNGTNWRGTTQFSLTVGGRTFHRSNVKITGDGVNNTIVHWTTGANGASAWELVALNDAVALAIADANAAKYKEGDKLGCVSAENTAILNAAIASLEVATTDAEKIDGIIALTAAVDTYKASVIAPVVDGGKLFFFKGLRGPAGEAYAKSNGVGTNAAIASYVATEKDKYLFELVTVNGAVVLKSRQTEEGAPVYMSYPANNTVLQGTLTAPTGSISTIRISPYSRTSDNRAMWMLEGTGYRLHTGGPTSPTPYGLYTWTGNAADNCSWDLIEYSPEVSLLEMITRANTKLNSYTEGTALGDIPAGSKAPFAAQIAAAQTIYDDYTSYTQSQIEAAELLLEGQITAFDPTPIAPKLNQWYVLQSARPDAVYLNKTITLKADGKLYWNEFSTIDDTNSRMMWKFVDNGSGKILMVNRSLMGSYVENKTHATGQFNYVTTEPNIGITFKVIGDAQVFIISNGQIHAESTGNLVCWTTDFTQGTSSTWKFTEVIPADFASIATKIAEVQAKITAETGKPGTAVPIASAEAAIAAAQALTVSAYQQEVDDAIAALDAGIAAIDAGVVTGVDGNGLFEKVYIESGKVKATHTNLIKVYTLTGVEVQNSNLKPGVYVAKVAGRSYKVSVK